MSMVQTEWWCLELPDEWSAEMEDDCVTISDCDGVSEIDITVVRKDGGDVDESDLKQFETNFEECPRLQDSYRQFPDSFRLFQESFTQCYILKDNF